MIKKHPTNRAERRKINEDKNNKRRGKQRLPSDFIGTVSPDVETEGKNN